MILVLCDNNVLLENVDLSPIVETKQSLSTCFDYKDLSDAFPC